MTDDRPSGESPRVLRMPGVPPPEAHATALERLLEAMCLTATINRPAADAYRLMFRVATVAATAGSHGPAVEKLLQALAKRLDQHLATLPNGSPPGAA